MHRRAKNRPYARQLYKSIQVKRSSKDHRNRHLTLSLYIIAGSRSAPASRLSRGISPVVSQGERVPLRGNERPLIPSVCIQRRHERKQRHASCVNELVLGTSSDTRHGSTRRREWRQQLSQASIICFCGSCPTVDKDRRHAVPSAFYDVPFSTQARYFRLDAAYA